MLHMHIVEFAILSTFVFSAQAVSRPLPSRDAHLALLVRQANCETQCTALSSTLSSEASGGLAAICNAGILNKYGACYGCQVQNSDATQAEAQNIVNAYTNNCDRTGHSVGGLTINADGTTTAGGSGAAGPASVIVPSVPSTGGVTASATGDSSDAEPSTTIDVGTLGSEPSATSIPTLSSPSASVLASASKAGSPTPGASQSGTPAAGSGSSSSSGGSSSGGAPNTAEARQSGGLTGVAGALFLVVSFVYV
ncbi:hypothetical protein FB45DRAFT_235913 [Roridomyces roridus]|uniref:Uncharacterized protein n=1 Tax=Roridomyces roridus TaxID=1738132 RepID=A0AAD7BBK0_9AGAR|nr:hypothetical protein FB45DRAFT_235913 [Roridomyces roridus]